MERKVAVLPGASRISRSERGKHLDVVGSKLLAHSRLRALIGKRAKSFIKSPSADNFEWNSKFSELCSEKRTDMIEIPTGGAIFKPPFEILRTRFEYSQNLVSIRP